MSYQRPDAGVEPLVERSQDDGNTVARRVVNRILVATDTSAGADAAVKQAAELARGHRAELQVLYVEPPLDAREIFAPDKVPPVDHVDDHLEAMQGRFPDVKVHTRKETGDLATTICAVAEQSRSDVIVLRHPGRNGKRRSHLGSVPRRVMGHSPCSVLLVDTGREQ